MSLSVLIAVTHLLGVGHLTRAAALGRGLAAAGHRVTLVSGGRPAPLVATAGLDLVQLPPVHCRGVDFATLLSDAGEPADAAVRQARIARLLAAFDAARPDVVVTETYPFGRRALAEEYRALLAAAAGRADPPAVLASIRDILNPPSRPSKAAEAEAVLGRFYDGVLVHGDAAVTPLAASWPTTPALERHLIYTGYVAEGAAPAAPARAGPEILVSGGGSAASLPLFEAAIGAAALPADRPWRLLVGHGVPEPSFSALAGRAGQNVTVERARPDFPALLAGAAVSVSQAGYNTAIDLMRAGTRAVLVPFEQGREAEQRLRAERLAAGGRAVLLPEDRLSPQSLAAAVAQALAGPKPGRDASALSGIGASVAAVEAAAARRRAIGEAWRRLDAALDRTATAGRTVDLWWRDDDAVRPTPALDRLLALARDHAVPLALAVIPAQAEPALAQRLVRRLATEPCVCVLVHGHAHTNHAPVDAKKQELGHRPAEAILAELAGGLARLSALFGAQALPVLVPPWNRIDPALVPRLAGIGFRGLSTFGRRRAPAADGLALANTHLDPIAWKAGGGLHDEAALLDGLARLVEDTGGEPIGLLTHHLVQDEWTWRFLGALLSRLARHSAVRWRAAQDLFPAGE